MLWAGVQSASSYGVQCRGCEAKVERGTPSEWPKGVYKRGLSGDDNLTRLHAYVLGEAVKVWNTRFHGEQLEVVAHLSS